MKRILLSAALLMACVGLKAQNCEALLLPYFGNDAARMEAYQSQVPDKFAWRCAYVRSAFYESDTIPAGAEQHSLSEVADMVSGSRLSSSLVVDLGTLSYYAYNFRQLQLQYPTGATVIYFPTPSSAHPYLVLRSLDQINELATKLWEAEGRR